MRMYNYYKGNSGMMRRVEDTPGSRPSQSARENQRSRPSQSAGGTQKNREPRQNSNMNYQRQAPQNTPRKTSGILEQIGSILPKSAGNLETEDIILLLILYLMYKDSGDTELLIIMGAMLLM